MRHELPDPTALRGSWPPDYAPEPRPEARATRASKGCETVLVISLLAALCLGFWIWSA